MISASAPAARRVSAVSRSDSPLATEDPDALTLITSALIHLPGHLERHPGAGGVLVEHRDDRAPAQRGQLLDLAAQQRLAEPVGVVEDRGGLVAGQVGRRQQMSAS